FEINGNSHDNLREFRDLLQNKGTDSSAIQKAENKKKARYTTHHYHNFAKS
ncbi:RpiR family transcriptional regulator, partial [Listeria monocytogenes]